MRFGDLAVVDVQHRNGVKATNGVSQNPTLFYLLFADCWAVEKLVLVLCNARLNSHAGNYLNLLRPA